MPYTPKMPKKRSRRKKSKKDELTPLDWIKIVLFVVGAAALVSVFIFLRADIGNVADDYGEQASELNAGKEYSKNQFNKQFEYANEQKREEHQEANNSSGGGNSTGIVDPNRGLSGLMLGEYPVEMFMASIAGETSGLANINAIAGGDGGRAYGIMQFDYRYDLVGFMNEAYTANSNLWAGFQNWLSYKKGDEALRNNTDIGQTFINAMQTNPEEANGQQVKNMIASYWTGTYTKLKEAGIDLNERHIAVSAAIFSINVNCGSQTTRYINNLNASMSDEEMIDKLYDLRNNVMSQDYVAAAGKKKGTNARYRTYEIQLVKDMLNGVTTVETEKVYGGGVEWHGPSFITKCNLK